MSTPVLRRAREWSSHPSEAINKGTTMASANTPAAFIDSDERALPIAMDSPISTPATAVMKSTLNDNACPPPPKNVSMK